MSFLYRHVEEVVTSEAHIPFAFKSLRERIESLHGRRASFVSCKEWPASIAMKRKISNLGVARGAILMASPAVHRGVCNREAIADPGLDSGLNGDEQRPGWSPLRSTFPLKALS